MTKHHTIPTTAAAPAGVAACPHCGSALLLMREQTEDIYIGELRLQGDDLADALPRGAEWAKGVENADYLVGCARCDAWLDEDDLVPATETEADHAYQHLAHLTDTTSNNWQAHDNDAGPAVYCQYCGSDQLVIWVERDVPLAAVFEYDDGSPELASRWLIRPWSVTATVRACNTCYRTLGPDSLYWQTQLPLKT